MSRVHLSYAVFTLNVLFALLVFLYPAGISYAQSEVDQLRNEINARNERLVEIEKEIAAYKSELQKVGAEKNTLQKAINQLELERKKVEADINYTQNRIGATDLEISKLDIEIDDTENSIIVNKNAISETLRRLNESDGESMVEALLRYDNLSEFWGTIDELEQIRGVMGDQVRSLASQKIMLESKYTASTKKRSELVDLKDQYTDQNSILSSNKQEKDSLLQETRNEEASYQQLLRDRETAREEIIRELRDFESKLQFILDPSSIPSPGTPVFNWPLESIVITQLFGGTEFAKQNASVYGNRPYHPGVDFGASVGTQILAPLAGVVRATGNTDAVRGCYSWGKWTLIDHANGLATLYAHQSVISVNPGQSVSTGQVVGYTGNTGYTTGPHLHFTVYAKAGVTIRDFGEIKAATNCAGAKTPTAATAAYIDPMLYLPTP
jgi:murein DD-endopeptidase MepM/ murein hydrolase activator NlpD